MANLTFRIIHFPKTDKYIGMAWNYEVPYFLATESRDSYILARKDLELDTGLAGHTLKWFDGKYFFDQKTEQLLPVG